MFSAVAALQTLMESTAIDEKQAEEQTVNVLMFMRA